MIANGELFLTTQEVAQRLKVNPNQVRIWVKRGQLNAFLAGKGYRISSSHLAEFERSYLNVGRTVS